MSSFFNSPITYFLQEGKGNLSECLRISFESAIEHDIDTILIFTGAGEGLRLAEERFRSQEKFSHIRLIGITFPQGKQFTDNKYPHRISDEDRDWFREKDIPTIAAHLPFDPIRSHHPGRGVLAQDSGLIGNAISIFGGGMSLCVQAVLIACDAGVVQMGDHIIALSADTSILVRCAPTEHFLTDLIVREILCKPVLLTVGKNETDTTEAELPFDTPPILEGVLDKSSTAGNDHPEILPES